MVKNYFFLNYVSIYFFLGGGEWVGAVVLQLPTSDIQCVPILFHTSIPLYTNSLSFPP